MLKHKKVIKMKLNKIILSFCVSILGLYSCSIVPTLSKFPVSDIRLGLNKADVKKQCGFPFRSDVFTRNHKRIDVLYYKEPARVLCEGFIITTALTFENDSLVSIIQSDKLYLSLISLQILFEGDKNIYKDGVSKCKFHFDNHTV